MEECIDVNERAFVSYFMGRVTVPPRHVIPVPAHNGATLLKPGYIASNEGNTDPGSLGVKVVSVRPGNAASGLATVPGVVLMLDEATGMPSAMIDGTYLTALRTAAGSAVATRLLANPNAKTCVIFGAGMQAEAHARAMMVVRPSIEQVTVVNRTKSKAETLAHKLKEDSNYGAVTFTALSSTDADDVAHVEAALRGAHIVCTTTNASQPLFDGGLLSVGAHINAVGSYTPAMVELDSTTLRRSALVPDTPAALEAGDVSQPMGRGEISRPTHLLASSLGQALVAGAPLGEVMEGGDDGAAAVATDASTATARAAECAAWRESHGLELTLFKSVGTALQDVATGQAVVAKAQALGLGSEVYL